MLQKVQKADVTNNENVSMDESTLSAVNSSVNNGTLANATPQSIVRRSDRRHTIIGTQQIDETRVQADHTTAIRRSPRINKLLNKFIPNTANTNNGMSMQFDV